MLKLNYLMKPGIISEEKNMKKTAFILILFLTLFSGKAAAQCVGDLKADITGGSDLICINTSPGTFTAVAEGESGSYTYLWYQK